MNHIEPTYMRASSQPSEQELCQSEPSKILVSIFVPSENERVRVDFTDVTLVEKDGQSVAAHSVILRVIRPYSEIF